MKTIATLPALKGKRVLVRVDYNVPLKKSTILDATRIEASIATINTVLKKGGTPVLIAHLGDGTASLRPIAAYLAKTYKKVVFIDTAVTDKKIHVLLEQVPTGTIVLLENIRRYPGEEKNTASFVKTLASLGSYYVNDAFSVSHRSHASIIGLPKVLPAYAGIDLQKELQALTKGSKVRHPSLFILGGAKFGTKIPLITRFEDTTDGIVIAGAILNTFYKVAGFEIGKSVTESGFDKAIQSILANPKLLLPVDVLVRRGSRTVACTPPEVKRSDVIVDIGPQSIELIAKKIQGAKQIIWNGPTGWYEKGYIAGTQALAQAIAQSSAQAIIGGGDTGAVIETIFKGKKHPHIAISTGGGATLEYLSKGTLPGVEALG